MMEFFLGDQFGKDLYGNVADFSERLLHYHTESISLELSMRKAACANNIGTDQPAHLSSLISTFVVCCLNDNAFTIS